MSTQFVSSESIVVLNDNFQYEPTKQVDNAKWVDLSNVMSVKRDKTIYAVRARNNFDFSQGRNNSSWFANINGAANLNTINGDFLRGNTFSSNIYRGFGTQIDGLVQNIFMTRPANVYGNLSANVNANLTQIGIGGSLLENNMEYLDITSATIVSGLRINVQSNVRVTGNTLEMNQSANLPRSFTIDFNGNTYTEQAAVGSRFANVDGNTSYLKLFYNNDNRTQWNRLINANLSVIGGNVCVTASTDPCDEIGRANPVLLTPAYSGTVQTNEAYRHQFQLRKNDQALASQNPIYIARVSRFGKSLTDNQGGNIVSKLSMHSFTGNFAAAIPGDNSLYAQGNVLTGLNLTGNIKMPDIVVFNSNFTTGNLFATAPDGEFNGNVTNNLNGLANNNRYMRITQNLNSSSADYVRGGGVFATDNGDINNGAVFKNGDRIGFVQANVDLAQGYMLLDRIAFRTADQNFVQSSRVFSAARTGTTTDFTTIDNNTVSQNYDSLWFQSNMLTTQTASREISSKYLVIKGVNIVGNNWQTVSLMSPNSIVMPTISGNPNLQYLQSGNLVNLYLRRGQLSMDNFTYVNNRTLTGVKYISSVPNFVQNVTLPLGQVVLSANVLTNATNGNLADPTNSTMRSLNIPLLPGASTQLTGNVINNYNFVFSGNSNVNERVFLNSNIVCPVNFANSFIANCWNYGTIGENIYGTTPFNGADINSNVSILYGNFPAPVTVNGVTTQVQTLSLNSEMSKHNIQYELQFPRSTGRTNAQSTLTQSNYVFYANVDSSGSQPNVNYTTNSQVAQSVLNDNRNINGMHLPEVAYSEYTFSSQSYKFTDVGNVLPLVKGTNFQVSTILPSAQTNTNSGTAGTQAELLLSDSFINIITDYLSFNTISANSTDNHFVTCSDFSYRYRVSGVTIPGEAAFNNSLMVNGSTFDPNTLFQTFNITATPLSGSVTASIASCYVYENIDNNTPSEELYPFTIPISDNSLVSGTTVNNLMPCFQWKAVSGGYSYFQNKTSNEVNFVLPNNASIDQNISIIINSVDTTNQTMKVGISYGSTIIVPKTIKIVPVVHGRSSAGTEKYATPIVCGVQGEPNTYCVVMVECANSNGGLNSTLALSLPASINLTVIRKSSTGLNQVQCQAALRVFDSNGTTRRNIVDNFTFVSPLSMFNFAPASQSTNLTSSLSLNVFSAPPNNAIISIRYFQSVVNKVLSFNRTDYVLNGQFTGYTALPLTQSSTNFAFSQSNPNLTSLTDPNNSSNPLINALSTRFYIESVNSGIWIDIRNDATEQASNMGVLRVDRSVEWTLVRRWNGNSENVGRGLLSKNSSNAATSTNSYLIYENLIGLQGSGYAHSLNTNLNDLCTRLLLQSVQTSSLITNGNANLNNWLINSRSDEINIMLVRVDPTNNNPLSLIPVKQASLRLVASGASIDLAAEFVNYSLSSRYSGSLGLIFLSSIRGFGLNPDARSGNVNKGLSMFSYNIQPDCYSLVQQTLSQSTGGAQGEVLTQWNVLFSEETNVNSNQINVARATSNINLSLNNASLAYQYLDTTSPALSTSSFVQIGYYVHNGYGQVQYYIKDFTSNYETQLASETITDNSSAVSILGNSSLPTFQVDNVSSSETPTNTVNILFDSAAVFPDGTVGKFYFNLDQLVRPINPSDRVYFRGTGQGSLPTQLNNKSTLLLYSGLRPLVLSVLQVAADNLTLRNVIQGAATFNWNMSAVNNGDLTWNGNSWNTNANPNIFTSLVADVKTDITPGSVSRQMYQVVLTNNDAATNDRGFLFRANRYSPTNAWLSTFSPSDQPNRNFFGTYVNASNLLNDLRLRVTRATGNNTVYNLRSTMRSPLENPQKSDDEIILGAISNASFTNNAGQLLLNSGSAAFTISSRDNEQNWGDMFTVSIQGSIGDYSAGDGAGFNITINPSTLTLYSALDTNNNGEIDTNVAVNVDNTADDITNTFGLNSMFSELNFKLPFSPTQYLKPAVVSSTTLSRQFIPVPGAPFDILLNNLFAVGYNLDCFFAIRNNIAAEFDVISIDTRANTNPNGQEVTNLTVNAATAPLVIANPNEWARSLVTGNGVDTNNYGNYGVPSGLTFKLKNSTKNVVVNEVVRLYVDNTIANNSLEWNVSVAGNTAKTYQLYSYDQDRYAALLDEQLAFRNKFVNEN